MNAKVGQRFTLLQHIGYKPETDPNDEFTAFKNDHHPLFAGQVGEVVAVVPAGVPGAGDPNEDSAVLEFEHRELVNHIAGKEVPEHVPGGYKRMFAVNDAQLADRTLYEPADDAESPCDLGPPVKGA